MATFIGRDNELSELKRFLDKNTASLIVVRGRRRIGKSRLIEEFAKNHQFLSFAGLAPTKHTTKQSELDEFSKQFSEETGLPPAKFEDWNTAFTYLAQFTQNNRVIIALDEISWMGSKDSDFLSKLKNAWDKKFKKNHKLILILCGSASAWIKKNILSSTGFVGRISYKLKLEELPIQDCKNFWGNSSKNISSYEKLKILSVTGGIPKYLEEINPNLTAEENIKNLCFTNGALLVDEFKQIFNSLFLHNSEMYKKIVRTLANGSKENEEICRTIGIQQTGKISGYLEELVLAGFVNRDYTWNIKTGLDYNKIFKYRLSDNYLRFYLKYIEKYLTQIERNTYTLTSLTSLPGWFTIIALQFENLVINNKNYLFNQLGLKPDDIINANPFFQRKTLRQPGCQIDYMIQTKSNCLYICEIKFSKNTIGCEVIKEVQIKIDRLKIPRGFSCRPVLIHVNGVSKELINNKYFNKIIDFDEVLK
ncbi:MAG: ATP-binding protein [Gammaproteobacteria bacterium]|jgi:AAA+ ATPase superfamily predicted ATPase